MDNPTTTPIPSVVLLTDLKNPSYYRGPLTTVYSPPTSCIATLTHRRDDLWGYFGHGASDYFDPACYPTGTLRGQDLVAITYWSQYYYSPGLCPNGWATVTTYKSSYPGLNPTEYLSLGSDTSAALCCPSGYAHKSYGHLCSSIITAHQVVSYLYPTNMGISWIPGTVSSTTFPWSTTVEGNGIPIWWQESDEAMLASAASAALTTDSSTISSSLTPSSIMSSTRLGDPTTTGPLEMKSTSGLSTGTQIGVGVGAGLGVLALVALGLVFCFRRRRSTQAYDRRDEPIPELPCKQMIHEMQGANASEIYTPTQTHYDRHELSGKSRIQSSHRNAFNIGLTS